MSDLLLELNYSKIICNFKFVVFRVVKFKNLNKLMKIK